MTSLMQTENAKNQARKHKELTELGLTKQSFKLSL